MVDWWWAYLALGAFVGFFGGLLGIGGASLTVPFLVKRNIRVHEAIGTAAAVGWPLALAGTLGYLLAGSGKPGLPEQCRRVDISALPW